MVYMFVSTKFSIQHASEVLNFIAEHELSVTSADGVASRFKRQPFKTKVDNYVSLLKPSYQYRVSAL